ncbi:MAG: Crp/Fnr family transcriptional regulator [Bdellovibrionales bacterium]
MSDKAGPITLKKGDILFEEGAPSDAMYVVKSGAIAITKRKGDGEIELARIMPGQLFGEMAFFDNKNRSAGARAALQGTVVISLPFAALHAQFKTFPEWLKSMVRTVNDHLRSANKRIQELEKLDKEDEIKFPPHTVTKLCSILALVASKYGEEEDQEGVKSLTVPGGVLRKYTIQIFQEPTHKMNTLMEWLQDLEILNIESLGEGQQQIRFLKYDLLSSFTEWYNKWLFTSDDKKVFITEQEMPILKALMFYSKKTEPQKDGSYKLFVNDIRNKSLEDLDYLVDIGDYDSLIEKTIVGDKIQEEGGITISFKPEVMDRVLPFWEILFEIKKRDVPGKK